jgi:hypothetical protein
MIVAATNRLGRFIVGSGSDWFSSPLVSPPRIPFKPVGIPPAGERSAVIYTLLGSCRRHGLNPSDYLKDLFTRQPLAKITEVRQFTPAVWARAKAKEKLIALAALTSRRTVELNLPFPSSAA